MGKVQDQHERAIAEIFAQHYNESNGTAFMFHGRGSDEPVDIELRDRDAVMHVQVTTAWYSQTQAAFLGRSARGDPNAPSGWNEVISENLVKRIGGAILQKCKMSYPANTVLVIAVYPTVTSAGEMERDLRAIEVPASHPFSGIYLVGDFPTSSESSGGYRCWRVDG